VRIRLSRAHHPVTVLGPGQRIGLWTQGCGIGCDGCLARDTWAPDPTTEVDIDAVLAWCDTLPDDAVDGVTISGGEPFDQPQALDELLVRLDGWRRGRGRPIDFLCYSGRSLPALRARFGSLLTRLDAVIPGPFVADQAPGLRWRGSANQLLVPLTDLGHERYDAEIDRPATGSRFQVEVDGDTVYQIGVPRPGDLAALEAAMARRGISFREASWWS
jgi:anaerobic ribonucleoside-triphosphate reductase activating protein